MLGTFAKAIMAFFTAGVVGALATFLQYWTGQAPLPPNFWTTALTALLGGLAAAMSVAQVRNTLTTGQITTAIKAGDVHPQTVAAIATTTFPTKGN